MARYLHPQREISVEKEDGRIGCASFGLVGYAVMLMFLGAGSLLCAGMTFNTAILMTNAPNKLISGVEVEGWRLSELRRWEVLDTRTPQLYHDHSKWSDGTSGCMVVEGVLVRWDEELESGRVPLQGAEVGIEGEDAIGGSVYVRGPDQRIDCPFGEEEGVERFYRMLDAESLSPAAPEQEN